MIVVTRTPSNFKTLSPFQAADCFEELTSVEAETRLMLSQAGRLRRSRRN